MAKLSTWKMACEVFVLCWATAIAAPAQSFETLVNFDGTNGSNPMPAGSLTQGRDGNLYGTTKFGGANNSGTIFQMTRVGTLTTLYDFCTQKQCADGANPNVGLVLAPDGSFYGTTYSGGVNGAGVIFKVTPRIGVRTLHAFAGRPTDGANPSAALTLGIDGELYGTTYAGGASGAGTVFKITPDGELTILHNFDGNDGGLPGAALVLGVDGEFYGTTQLGGSYGDGSVFKITGAGVLSTLHSFDSLDGAQPAAPLVYASDGNFYGTTQVGGASNLCEQLGCGTVFKINPTTGKLITVHSFRGTDGALPLGALIQATDRNLYGTTGAGGPDGGCGPGCGTIFEIKEAGALTLLHDFDFDDGEYPQGGLLEGTNGILYGSTWGGGAYASGTLYSLNMGFGPFVTFVRAVGRIGQTGGILGQGFTGTTNVSLNGSPTNFKVVSDTYLTATVPPGATTGLVTVVAPTGTLTSNVLFHVIP